MTLHLRAFVLAACLIVLVLQAGLMYARAVEARVDEVLVPDVLPIKNLGLALQQQAFRRPDLLPVYGSSEMEYFTGPYTGSTFFASAPTGFGLFSVGAGGTTPLLILERLAAIGPDVHGKKVVILASPTFFRGDDRVRQSYYGGNFSPLHAYEVVFGGSLSPGLQRTIAGRMLDYPATLEREPLLRFGLERLVGDGPVDRLLLRAAMPLGWVRSFILKAQDHWHTVNAVRSTGTAVSQDVRHAQPLDWDALRQDAERLAREQSASNEFGFDDEYWQENRAELKRQRGRLTDKTFLNTVKQEFDWTDFELLLQGLRELGAEPLILSVPMKGVYYDYWGVSSRSREAYYRRIQLLADRYKIPVHTFAEADASPYFTGDSRSHPSQLGWLAYDQAIDAFYHGTRRK